MTQKVMISSTTRDLSAERSKAMVACQGLGLFPVMMEDLPALDADAIDASLKIVDDCAVYVGIFAFRYGYVPQDAERNPEGLSVTELEYRRAVEKGKPRLIFVASGEQAKSDPENQVKWKVFRELVLADRVVQFFDSPDALGEGVAKALEHWLELRLLWQPEPLPHDSGCLPDPLTTLPPGSRMFVPRNAYFVGRENTLLALAQSLLYGEQDARAVISPLIATTGEGGIGKTQTAIEFAYRYGCYFHGVHWIDLYGIQERDEVDTRFNLEVAACGERMELSNFPDKLAEQVALTLRVWRDSPPRLVILDNVERPHVAQRLLPRLPAGVSVLITSRSSDRDTWRDLGVATCSLDVLSRGQSLHLLRNIAPHLVEIPDADLDRLAARLGDFPLALDLAAHYLRGMRHNGQDVAAYLTALDDLGNPLEHPSLRDWAKQCDHLSPTDHEMNVAATFALSWKLVTDPVARELFLACGHLAPNEPIPVRLLQRLTNDNREALASAQSELVAAGLLRSDPVQIHPLLAAFAQSQFGAADQLSRVVDALAQESTAAYETALPTNFLPLRPHIEAVAPAAETVGDESAAMLWNNLSSHFQMIADYPSARTHVEHALRIAERCCASDHPAIPIFFNNLGNVLQAIGDLPSACDYYERALAISEDIYGLDHPSITTCLNNLGHVLKSLGDLSAARICVERALRIDERIYGPDHPNVATNFNNLGILLKSLGELSAARTNFERALAIRERVLGHEHPDVAQSFNSLGRLQQELGDLSAARNYYEHALAIHERVYGLDHPIVAMDCNNLATLGYQQGDLVVARTYLERALGIYERTLPPDHPRTENVRLGLATVNAASPGATLDQVLDAVIRIANLNPTEPQKRQKWWKRVLPDKRG